MSRRLGAAACAALALLVAGATLAAADTLKVRVLTYNAWDLALVSTDRAERIARIGPAIAELAPDVVAFQELWVDADAARVAAELARVGLVHTRRFPSGFVGSGLLIASRYPITESSFQRYTFGGKPQKPWHGDWYGGKGIGRVTVETPLGAVEFADTHLHASYDDPDEYALVQLAEALEAADFLGVPGERPLIFGGDLNVSSDTLPFRLLASRSGLSSIERDPGIDWVLFRRGARVTVRVLETRKVLDAPVDVGGGRRVPLSDHEGVLAVLELATAAAATVPCAPDLAAARDGLALIREEIAASTRRSIALATAGVILLGVGVALLRAARRRTEKRRRLVALALLVVLGATGTIALGALYGPYERHGLLDAQARLERP
jgi:endonuclease/exonuclease/phosphatase family metal-dependent hydrolase